MNYIQPSLAGRPPMLGHPPPSLPPPPSAPPPPTPPFHHYIQPPQFKPPPPLPLPAVSPLHIPPPPPCHAQNANDWRFSKSEMYWTATRLHNESSKEAKDESLWRYQGATLIFTIGIFYQAPQDLIATAQVLYHRFYMRESMPDNNFNDIAAATLWIAWKVEFDGPSIPKLSDYITTVARKVEKNDNLIVVQNDQLWTKWKIKIQYAEQLICDTLCWDLWVELPYDYVFELGRLLGTTRYVAEKAVAIVNDSCRLPLLLHYAPREVALAAIYMGTVLSNEALRIDAWQITDADTDRIREIVREIVQLYTTRSLYKPPIQHSTAVLTPSGPSPHQH